MVKQIVVHPYQGILFSNKKEHCMVYTAIWINFQRIMLSGEETVPKGHIRGV